MVEIRNFGIISDRLEPPADINEALKMVLDHNKVSDAKISIFKSYQEIGWVFNKDEQTVQSKIKDNTLSNEAVKQLIDKRYCIIDKNLFFISCSSVTELENIHYPRSATELIKAISSVKGERGLTEEELTNFIKSAEKTTKRNSKIQLTASLYPYQKVGLDWLKNKYNSRLGGILADDMGLGKTIQVIALIAETLSKGTAEKVLIVVPNSLINNWLNEFKKFSAGISPLVHWGTERDGFVSALEKANVIISTYSTVSNDLSLFRQIPFDILVCDEASLLKNPDSQRTKSINQLSAGSIIQITGTPFENSMLDLWSLSNLIEADYLGERNAFEAQYVRIRADEFGKKDVEDVEEQLRPLLLRRMKENVLTELPKRLDIPKPLTMNATEEKEYRDIEQQIRSSDNENIAFALISNLRKYTAHPLLSFEEIETASLTELESSSSKFSYLKLLINKIRLRGDKALVFANHIRLLDSFCKVFRDEFGMECFKVDGSIRPIDRQEVINRFSAVKGSALLFLNPITAGMGLNITSANHVIHYSRQWNPALEEQATARAYRNGQKNQVNVYYLYYANTIEEIVHERILWKSFISGNVIRPTTNFRNEDEMILQLISDRVRD